jgi:hypothetical protein
MNRAERQRKYRTAIKQFHRASKGAFQATIVTREELIHFMRTGASGDAVAQAIVTAIANWLRQAATVERGEAPLCLDCDTTFIDGVLPDTFTVIIPSANSGHALVSGVCGACVARCGDGLMTAAAQRWRTIWPDLHIVEGQRFQH